MESNKKTLRKAKEIVNALSLAPNDTIDLEISKGINEIPSKDGIWKEFELDPNRYSIVIRVNGGSGEESLNRHTPGHVPLPNTVRSGRIKNNPYPKGPIKNTDDGWPEG